MNGTNGSDVPQRDELVATFHEIDAIHKHVGDHGCGCKRLRSLIVDLWTRLVHTDRIWNELRKEEPGDAGGTKPE